MTLRDELKALLPDNVQEVKIDRGIVKGVETVHVTVRYKAPGGINVLDSHFAKNNKMSASELSKSIISMIAPGPRGDAGNWHEDMEFAKTW